MNRRSFLIYALASAGLLTLAPKKAISAISVVIQNVTGLYSVNVAKIEVPTSTADVVAAVRTWQGKISIGGGRYSMGGQTAITGGLHIDMRGMKQLVALDEKQKIVRIQSGMRWRDLQDILDPKNLAIKTMQSYANFTVGGSVSVNAHGRYVGNGPIINSVRALQIVLSDGSIKEVSRTQNEQLFRAAFGGYGAIGVITEVELDVTENIRIEREVVHVPLASYPAFYEKKVKETNDCIFHNADLLPPLFNEPIAVSWRATSKAVTDPERLIPRDKSYGWNQDVIWALTELPGKDILNNKIVHPLLLGKRSVTWRNHEASEDVAELEPRTRVMSTYVLQEYFVPVRNFEDFVKEMASIIRANDAQVMNISIRHSPADTTALLPWAKEEVFSFVIYYKQRTYKAAREKVGKWTRKLIDCALKYEGRYYLPYQLHATQEQFNQAYPEAEMLRAIKHSVDPTGKFTNELWAKYL